MKWGKKSRKVSSITTRTAERWVYDVLKPVGLHDFEAHDLRRLFATIYTLRSEGMGSDLLGVQTILGHQRLGTTAIYIIDQLHNTNRIVNGFFRGTSKYLTGIKPTEPQRRREKKAKKIKANPQPQEKAKKA